MRKSKTELLSTKYKMMLLQKKWKSKRCYPRGISQDCQRRFGKWRSGHRKGKKIIKAVFATVLKARIALAED